MKSGKLFAILILLIAANITIFPQIKIKEKVEIKPGSSQVFSKPQNNNQLNRGFTPCGPYIENTQTDHYWQVVWVGYWGPIDPAQQLFGTQGNVYFGNFVNPSNGPFEIQIIEGAEYASFQECVPIDEYGCGWTDMEETSLSGISGSELIGSGNLMVFDCVPRRDDQTYHIRYHYLEQNEAAVTYSIHSVSLNQTKYFHTLIEKRPFVFEENSEPIEIPHAEEDEFIPRMEAVFCSSLDSSEWYANYNCKGAWNFSAGGGFPDNVKFNVSIVEGEEYGTMFYRNEYNEKIKSNSFTNIGEDIYYFINFEANGIEPEDTGKVKIHISTTDADMPGTDVNINVAPNQNYPIRVTFLPAVLSAGDTANIYLKKRIDSYPFSDPEDVSYEPFLPHQLFDIKIERGKEYGTILNTAELDTADEFVEIEEGFKFIASNSIDIDTAKISIRVTTKIDDGGIILASPKTKGTTSKTLEQIDKIKPAPKIKSREIRSKKE